VEKAYLALHYITLKISKCPKLIETAKALGLSMLNNTSHAGKETENEYVFKREQKIGRVVADVEESCSKFLDPDVDEFINVIYSSLSKGTSLVKFS